MRQRLPVRHVTLPFVEVRRGYRGRRETVDAFLRRSAWARRDDRGRWAFPLPTICVVNGTPILQAEWKRRRIRRGDDIVFVSRPWGGALGGGGSNSSTLKAVGGIVALIALTAIAGPLGTMVAGAAFGGSAIAASLITGAVLIGGGLLISALTKPKAGGQTSGDGSTDQVAQLYSVSASGNTARLLQPLSVQYGRVKSFPDFAITPWSEFDGNDQYLNVLLSTGLGKYSYETLYIDDTILWTSADGISGSFAGVTVDFYDPGVPVDLFPVNVTQSGSVSGQDITQTPVGGFVANTAGTLANAIAVDVVFPAGCFTVNTTDGTLSNASATVVVEARTVDGAGAPVGSWVTIATQGYTFSTRNPQRASIKVDVSPDRYEVRVSRTDATIGDTSGANDVVWAGLRAFLQGPTTFPVSTVAIRIKANSQLTSSSARKFGVLCTRVLPVWDVGSQSFIETATRNPFWAAYNAATDTQYGAGRPADKIDLQGAYDHAAGSDTRGDHFDYRFDVAVAVPEALDTILRVSRSRHRWSGDVLTWVRDEWSDVPRMLLTDREIARNSLTIEYALNLDDAADAVILEYVDENTWGAAEIQYPHNSDDFTSVSPTSIRIPGVVNRDHAHREAAFYYFQSQLRRINVALDTEHDGRMLGYGSRVRVQTELPLSWGYTGQIVSVSGSTLTVDPAPTWESGTHYVAIRTKTGRQFGPILCTQGAFANLIVLDGTDLSAVQSAQSMTLAEALARATAAEPASFDFGISSKRARDCIVMSGRPVGDRVTLGLVVDNVDVHTTDLPDTPLGPTPTSLFNPTRPSIVGLYAVFRQGTAEPIVDASWQPAPGADHYIARVTYDTGASYTQVYEGKAAQFSVVVPHGSLILEVAAVGTLQGDWATFTLAAQPITLADGTVGLDSLIAGLQDQVTNVLKNVNDQNKAILDFIATYTAEQDAHNFLDKIDTRVITKAQTDNLKVITDDLSGNLDTIGSRVTTAEEAISTADDTFAAFVTNVTTNYATNTSVATAKSEAISASETFATGALSAYDITVRATYSTQTATATAISNVQLTTETYADHAISAYDVTVQATYTTQTATATAKAQAIAAAGVYSDHAIGVYDVTVQATYTTQTATASAKAEAISVAETYADHAVAATDLTVNASFNGLSSSVSSTQTAVAAIGGHLAASYAVTLNVNGYASGFKLLSDGTVANVAWLVDNFTIGSPGFPNTPVFNIGTAGGVAAVTIHGDLYADGTIITRHLISDAATRMDVVQNGNVGVATDGNAYNIASLAITSVGGKFFIEGSCGFDVASSLLGGANVTANADVYDFTLQLRLDGSPLKSISVPGHMFAALFDSSSNVVRVQTRIKGHYPVTYAAPIAAGSHTIDLVLIAQFPGALTFNAQSPTILCLEARR